MDPDEQGKYKALFQKPLQRTEETSTKEEERITEKSRREEKSSLKLWCKMSGKELQRAKI